MTSGRGPLASRLSIATRACHSELSLISMFHSATGSRVPPPESPRFPLEGPESTETDSTLKPPLSDISVICCQPAPSVAVKLTVVQFCQPPVLGTQTCCHTLLAPLKPTCRLPPPGEATRAVI